MVLQKYLAKKQNRRIMLLKVGSRGKEVKELQEFLEIGADGIFGVGTEAVVRSWQSNNGLVADGIVGPKTWDAMGLATTDASEQIYTTENGLVIERHFYL
jgi:murein L,D-transpeptidase YcbB/YkuD